MRRAGFPALGAERAFLARWLEARSYDGDIERAGEPFGAIVEALCGTRFCGFLEQLTGIAGLEPDRRHVGAGLHQGINGSYLRVHADHNTHPHDPARYRRVNILIYLNDTWDERWNGDLELWDSGATSCRARIAPIQNRCVVLGVDDAAFHGYGPLCLPPGGSRKALAFYYYADRPAPRQAERPHATILPRLNGERARSRTSTTSCDAALFGGSSDSSRGGSGAPSPTQLSSRCSCSLSQVQHKSRVLFVVNCNMYRVKLFCMRSVVCALSLSALDACSGGGMQTATPVLRSSEAINSSFAAAAATATSVVVTPTAAATNAAPQFIAAAPADSFVDSIGVDTHFNYGGTSYVHKFFCDRSSAHRVGNPPHPGWRGQRSARASPGLSRASRDKAQHQLPGHDDAGANRVDHQWLFAVRRLRGTAKRIRREGRLDTKLGDGHQKRTAAVVFDRSLQPRVRRHHRAWPRSREAVECRRDWAGSMHRKMPDNFTTIRATTIRARRTRPVSPRSRTSCAPQRKPSQSGRPKLDMRIISCSGRARSRMRKLPSSTRERSQNAGCSGSRGRTFTNSQIWRPRKTTTAWASCRPPEPRSLNTSRSKA